VRLRTWPPWGFLKFNALYRQIGEPRIEKPVLHTTAATVSSERDTVITILFMSPPKA